MDLRRHLFAVVVLLVPHSCALAGSTGDPLATLDAISSSSACASHRWRDRGRAPPSYIAGVSRVFARAACQAQRADVAVASAPADPSGGGALRSDALAWYDREFRAAGMTNAQAGVATLRHLYVLMLGLGMRESSGKYCAGRDLSADFVRADDAEAGTFQTSWGAHRYSPPLGGLFKTYSKAGPACMLETFRKGVACSRHDAVTYGAGDGARWQQLTKRCPAFGAEYAAVVVRLHGGSAGEFGPIRRRDVEIRPECDAMLKRVQAAVEADPGLCRALR